MSTVHLSSGSTEPSRVEGLLRVYSMIFCPYAKRARLVVKAKNLPHDIVNINLQDKPEWYFNIHPKGQVPALLDNGKHYIESLDIADYLDEKYPTDQPLYPRDPEAKKREQNIIRNLIDPVTKAYFKISFSNEPYTPEKALSELIPVLQPLEDELATRPGPFFGGDKPGMVDYMLWPFFEMILVTLPYIVKVETNKVEVEIPKLRVSIKAMKQLPLIQELAVSKESFVKINDARRENRKFDYDSL